MTRALEGTGTPGNGAWHGAGPAHRFWAGAQHCNAGVVASHSLPLEFVTSRQFRTRRASHDEALPNKPVQNSMNMLQSRSIKQRLRQRRFSIAIGETLPLRTIKEQDNSPTARDQSHTAAGVKGWRSHGCTQSNAVSTHNGFAAAQQLSRNRLVAVQDCCSVKASACQARAAHLHPLQYQLRVKPLDSIPADQDHWAMHQGAQLPAAAAGCMAGGPMQPVTGPMCHTPPAVAKAPNSSAVQSTAVQQLQLQQLDARHPAALRPGSFGAAEPQVPRATSGNEAPEWLALLQPVATQDMQVELQHGPQLHTPLQQQQQQQLEPPQVLQVHHLQQQQPGQDQEQIQQLWQYLQQQEQQPGDDSPESCRDQRWSHSHHQDAQQSVLRSAEVSGMRRCSAGPGWPARREQQRPAARRWSSVDQAAAAHAQATSTLQLIEHELQQLVQMESWLTNARAVAVPGTRAATVCDSALLQHQAVLQQALDARAALQAAVADTEVLLRSADQMARPHMPREMAALYEAESHLDFSGREGFEEERTYPEDAATLLQYFGHYAII